MSDELVDILVTPYYYSLRAFHATMRACEQKPTCIFSAAPPSFHRTHSAVILACLIALIAAPIPAPAQQQPPPAPKPLTLDKPIEDTLQGGDSRAYTVDLRAGDFIHIVADQRGIDVVLTIAGPDDKQIAQMDSLNAAYGPENLSAIATVAGSYGVEVSSFDKTALPGKFEIRVTALRPAKPGDETRIDAEKAYAHGIQLYQGDDASTKSAIPILQQALKGFQSTGDVHGQAAALYALSACHQRLGAKEETRKEFDDSIRLFEESGSLRETAEVIESLAGFEQDQGQKDEAEASFREALDLWAKANGTEDAEYVRITVGLARLLLVEQKYSAAEPLFERAIARREKIFGPDSIEVADVLQSYGVILHDEKKYTEAEKMYRRAIDIRTKAARPDDARTLGTVVNNLAVLFDDQHKMDDAEKYYLECLRIRKAGLPRGDPDTISTMDNLIRIYRDSHRNADAEQLDREAYDDVKAAKGDESKDAAYRLDALSFFLLDENKSDEAITNFQHTTEIRKKILDPKDPDIATSVSNLAFAYYKKEDYPPAISNEKQAVDLYKADSGDSAPVLSDHYAFLATLSYRSEKYDDAVSFQNLAIANLQANKTQDNKTLGVAINNLGLFIKAKGDYKDAEEKFQTSLDLLKKAKDRSNEAIARHNLGNTYEAAGNYPAAQDCYRQAVIIEQELNDKTNEADTLLDLAGVLARQRQSGPALDTYRSALAIERELGDRGMQAYALNGIGDLYKSANQYDQATETYLQAVSIREEVYPNSNGLAETLTNLAEVYKAQGKYSDAEAPLRRALEIREKKNATSPAVVSTLNNLAAVLNSEGKWSEAEPLFRRAIAIEEKNLGADSAALAAPLATLAGLYSDQGQYSDAEALYRRALNLAPTAKEPNQSQIADMLNALSAVYRAEGRYTDAARTLTEAIAIQEKLPGADASSLADSYSTLADLYKSRRDYARGADAAEHASKLIEQDQGKTTALYAKSLDTLADFYALQAKYDAAAKTYSQALEIQTKFSGKDSPDLALTADSLAEVYLAQYKTQEAEPLLLHALAIREKVFGPAHPRTGDTVQDLAVLYYYEGNREKAAEFFRRREDSLRSQLTQSLPSTSDKDRRALLTAVQDFFPAAYSFAYANRDSAPAFAQRLYELVLWQKALSLGSFTSARRRATAGGDPEISALLERLASKRSELAAFIAEKHEETEDWRAAEEKLADQSLQLEREYIRRLDSHAAAAPITPPTLGDIKQQLPKGDVAVEYLRFTYDDVEAHSRKPLYVALVLIPGADAPSIVPLGDAATLEAEPVAAYQHSLAPAAHPDSTKLYNAFWKPLEPLFGGATRIFISPDGALDQVSFAAVTSSDGKPLLEKYELHLLPSTRDLVRTPAAAHSDNTAILFGNPSFSLTSAQYRSSLAAIDAVAQGMTPPPVASAETPADAKAALAPLPGGAAQIESIAKLLRDKSWQVQLYEGPLAVEEAAKSAHSPKLIHISTRSFYLHANAGSETPATEIPGGLDDPSLLAGLYFAGANSVFSAADLPSDVEDGILSAYEAANLDLKGTELVVLSTESSSQAPSDREQEFAIPRAMLRAGADAVLTCLWPTSEKDTAEFMDGFYKHWLAGDDKWTALRKSQQELRASILKHTGKDDPSRWGSCTLIGR